MALIPTTGLVILLKLDWNRQFFLASVILKFDNGWPRKTIRHLFYATSSFVHHLIAIGEFTVKLQSTRKRTIWVKICYYLSCVTLKFERWPWKTTGHHLYATSSFVHHFVAISEFKLELQSGNAQIGSQSWNLINGFEKQLGTSLMPLQAVWIIS